MTTESLALYRRCTPVVDRRYDTDGDRTLVDALVEAVASAEGVDPVDLAPLYESVDLDALSRLLEGHSGTANTKAIFGFQYRSWNVFVRADGHIRVCDSTKDTAPEPVFASVNE